MQLLTVLEPAAVPEHREWIARREKCAVLLRKLDRPTEAKALLLKARTRPRAVGKLATRGRQP
jgi:hypothetical protein